MKRQDVRVCVLRVAGTNCDAETKRAFQELGVRADVLHLNQLSKNRSLLDYSVLVFPGGFSYGDYVRAGAIFAKMALAKLGKDFRTFAEENRPILGICNGFQVLVESGLLPGFEGASDFPEATLATNLPAGYNCRWINVKQENRGKCVFTSMIKKGAVLRLPIGHGEGRFMFSKEKEKEYLDRIYENDQLVFRYCRSNGEYAGGEFPVNPNGAFHDIAGMCNPEGTVFGLMPHPERAFYKWQNADWTAKGRADSEYAHGRLIFESVISYLEKRG